MKKVLFIATVVKTHINVFHLPYIQMFKENGYKTFVAAKNDFENEEPVIPYCDSYEDIPFSRNPFNLKNIASYRKLKKLIEEEKFDIVQCNTPVGGVLGRLAARKMRKNGTRIIYIAHGFHFLKGGPLLSWVIFYPIEKFLSCITDVLVTINHEDYSLALKHFGAVRTAYIHGVGVDTEKIEISKPDRNKVRAEFFIKENDTVLISVGELRALKNHKVIIEAMAKLGRRDIHYIIAGEGPMREELRSIASRLGLCDNIHLPGFRGDIYELLKSSDIFCFPSKREGLPVSLMEAMASGLAAVVSCVRGNTDLVCNNKGGFIYSCDDACGFAHGIKKLTEDKNLRRNMGQFNKEFVKKYDIKIVKEELSKIYFSKTSQF